ncbi:iron-containing redox enzyme family protein [Streptomyces sp. NPDC058751]|uniref:iron-containing redox enzyme family protein n=1 Tax=Streptomyces sp. NPDC058751 TaxID=3346623 RepID=UPI0036B2E8F4
MTGPRLPRPRGPVSAALLAALRGSDTGFPRLPADAYADDPQLALYVLYELHYRGFEGVPDDREWDPRLLTLRAGLEDRFLCALRADAPVGASDTAEDALDELQLEPVGAADGSLSHFLRDHGTLGHVREYAALRSLYHLKEADPHAWVIPRLYGRAKAAMAAVEFDEFGAGRPDEIHARLFVGLMTDLGLDTSYGHYLDAAPAEALATVNLMSLLGLHRALRGALVGHFATVEVTSSPASRRLAQALGRLDAGAAAVRFYTEHVEADAVHEQVVRHEVVAGLLADEPWLESDVVFGIRATGHLEDRLAARLLPAWRDGGSALRADRARTLRTPLRSAAGFPPARGDGRPGT